MHKFKLSGIATEHENELNMCVLSSILCCGTKLDKLVFNTRYVDVSIYMCVHLASAYTEMFH
jgi:hypothetical protein